jgi:hypothetical protein
VQSLPFPDLLAGLIAVFVGHVEIAEDDGVMAVWVREDLFRAFDAIGRDFGFDGDFLKEFLDNLK